LTYSGSYVKIEHVSLNMLDFSLKTTGLLSHFTRIRKSMIANPRSRLSAAILLGLTLMPLFGARTNPADAAGSDYFRITVQDAETGRGVPLVELRTVNEVRYYTDSNGIAAINDPELLGQNVYFRVSSPGYDAPADGFGYRGKAFQVAAGGSAIIKIKRINIAERLYRITGAGIYRDSVLTGQSVPLKEPLLSGKVMGQDTVMAAIYGGKLVWFYGDTNRPSYPLGQFAISGATSPLPARGGLDPSRGIDLTYWVGQDGFSRPMIPIPNAPGPVWIGGLFTMQDQGREHLFAHYAEIHHDSSPPESGLAEFSDTKAVFEPIRTFPKNDPLHPEGTPFHVKNKDKDYLYFGTQQMGAFPLVRNTPDLVHIADSKTYEAFTCLAPGARFDGPQTRLDRAADGHLLWAWKANTAALGEDEAVKLVSAGKMKQEEVLTQLRDIETDKFVTSHGGTVFWNSFRKQWIMITTQVYGSPSYLGEVWFAEADTPVGPWLYARKVATHDHYSFYNPAQHPFFDQDGGRLIYFEGTYVDTYSGVTDLVPRYNYNQLMYRLDLDDKRLALPSPVYAVKRKDEAMAYQMREQVEGANAWPNVQSVAFYAVAAGRPHADLIPLYDGTARAAFYALPVAAVPTEKASPSVVSLYEYKDISGKHWYSTESDAKFDKATRSQQPICRVWRNPSSILALDFGAKPDDR
jgi:hypothetical protein